MTPARLLSLLLLTACTIDAPAPATAADPAPNEAVTPWGEMMFNDAAFVITPIAGPAVVVIDSAVVQDEGSTLSPDGITTFSLDWEGEQLDGEHPTHAVRQADGQLVIGGGSIDPRPVESRANFLSLTIPGDVAAGETVTGELLYGETPEDTHIVDALLGDTVQVEILEGSGAVGDTLSVRVTEAQLEPRLDIGAAFAGEFFEGTFALDFDPEPLIDCQAVTADELAFISSTPQDLGTVGPVYVGRENQGSDPMKPFQITGATVDTLTSLNGTKSLTRVSGLGGVLEVAFEDTGFVYGMETRSGPGDTLFEVARFLTIDATTWGPGFPVTLTRTYADAPQTDPANATCTVSFVGSLQ